MKPFFEDGEEKEVVKLYREVTATGAKFVERLVRYAIDIIDHCSAKSQKDTSRVHGSLLALARLQIGLMDSTGILLEKGCVEGCPQLLRSALDAQLGIFHITRERHEERALAYELARIKREIRRLRRGDKTQREGQDAQLDLASDCHVPRILDKMPADLGARVAKTEKLLSADLAFVPILAEWDRLTHRPGKPPKKDPEWYSLFGTATNTRELAKNLGCPGLYHFMYKDLSDATHAGNALDAFANHEGESSVRQLRHPGGYHVILRSVFSLFLMSFERLASFYDKEAGLSVQRSIEGTYVPEFERVMKLVRGTLPVWRCG